MTTAAAQAPAPGKLEFKDDYTPDEAERVIRNSKGLPVGVRPKMVWTWKKALLWAAIAIVCACGWAILAVSRGERISAIWFLVVALSSYAIAYRFYAYYIQIKIMRTDDANATPAERVHDGANFERTDRRVLFGQHFAGISGAGPLVGPILAAQMGYLPSTLWIILGVIFAGACFVLITVCVAKMGYWKHLWIPVVPLVWDIAVTFTADFQKIFGPLSYFTTASKYQAQIDSGELTGEALTNAKAALSNAYLDGVLSVFFLVMMGVFVVVGIVVVARTFAAGKYGAETTSEEPFVESQWFAPSSLVATALEKKVQREYSAKLHELVRNGQVAA